MADYSVTYPLWDIDGLVSEDPDELRDILGVSGGPLVDLRQWQAEWEAIITCGRAADPSRNREAVRRARA